MQTPIHQRATELVEKGGMPWSEAENLALSEFGITDADIDELKGECCGSTILTGDDIAELIRSVLVHGAGLLIRNPEAVAAQQPIQARELSDEQAQAAFPHLYTMTLSMLPDWKQRALLDGIKTAFIAATGPNTQQPMTTPNTDSPANIERMSSAPFSEFGVFFLYRNKHTGQLVPGKELPEPTGDTSVDGAWVFFDIFAESPDKAFELASVYFSSPQCKFTDGLVTIKNRVAYVGHARELIHF